MEVGEVERMSVEGERGEKGSNERTKRMWEGAWEKSEKWLRDKKRVEDN